MEAHVSLNKFLDLNAGDKVTPNCSMFLKSCATLTNFDFGPMYPIAEMDSIKSGSKISKYAGLPSSMVLIMPVFWVVYSAFKLPSPTSLPVFEL